MAYPTCSRCGKDLKDWNGQVLVDRKLWPKKADWVKIVCRPCSCELVEIEGVDRYQAPLELDTDFKNKQGLYNTVEFLLDHATLPNGHKNRTEFSRQALGDLLRLVALAMKVEIDEDHHHDVWEVQRW